jgi:PAS domain S-box-containing protein
MNTLENNPMLFQPLVVALWSLPPYVATVAALLCGFFLACALVVWRNAMRQPADTLEHDLYLEVLRRTAHGVVVTDVHGRIQWVNASFERITGYTLAELRGQKPGKVLQGPQTCPQEAARMSQAVRERRATTVELVNYRKDGAPYSVRIQLAPLTSPSGQARGFMAIESDISEQITNREQLRQRNAELERLRLEAEAASEAKSAFLANMSHEIRTPLTAILGYTDVLRDEGDLSRAPVKRLELIDTIRLSGQHLMRIINDVLDLSKIEAGKLLLESTDTPLDELLLDVDKLLQPQAQEKGLRLSVRLTAPIPRCIVSDPTRLRQVLYNIVGNAVKFTARGSVTITGYATSGANARTVTFDVEDTGPGMSETTRRALFRPFSQGDVSVTRTHGGTGLGLTISRHLIVMLGGTIEVVRSAPGQGSLIRICLPYELAKGAGYIDHLTPRAPERTVTPAALHTGALHGRVLLAEDGKDNQRLFAFLLQRAGLTVDVCDNGQHAIETYEKTRSAGGAYDLIITDIQMPVMDGYQFVRELRLWGVQTPVIALTAHAMSDDRQRCIDAGCNDYATKPITPLGLISLVQRWLPETTLRAQQAAA